MHDPGGDWSTLASLMDRLLDTAPEDRAALIDELSAGDAARRSQLEQLLSECDHEPELFSRPAAERFAALFDQQDPGFPDALARRYRLERELGRGGMATVYLARDLKHARDVAVKVVHPAVATALGPERFLREIEIVAQLDHPHLVPLYDSGSADGVVFYVMPYKNEPSLRRRLDREGALPIDDALVILRDVCDGLAFAHGRGIVHRDVKPDNVLLSGRHAMLTDFGIAQSVNDLPADTLSFGTPAYMSPEQIDRDAVIDQRADIYSLGVLAYELLAGRLPFDATTRSGMEAAQLAAKPPNIVAYRADVPAPLARIVMKCLEKRPEDRWQTSTEVLSQLESLGTFDAVASRRTRTRRWATMVGVAAACVAALVWWRRAQAAASWPARWANARIERLTDFPGSEVDAAISRDGNSVAFLADSDHTFDAFLTRVGTGKFVNLTNGRVPDLYNEDVRNVGFASDSSRIWLRVAAIDSPPSVSMMPAAGGTLTPFLHSAVMAVWSPDGARVAYHEAPSDPIFIANSDGTHARRIFVAAPGIHSHDLTWSPDGRFIYFSHGTPPDEMDIWRVPTDSGPAERMTTHNARVAYPSMLDDHTLLYSATADDGTGPWLYMMNVAERVPRRVTTGIEHYLSVSASADHPGRPRRLVATVSNPSVQLWSAPVTNAIAGESLFTRLTVPTARSAAPRFGPDSAIWYLASRAGADGLWRLDAQGAREIWASDRGAVVGAAAPSPDGKTTCFPVHRGTRSSLMCTNPDGTGARVLAESLDVRGAPSWSPDGTALVTAVRTPAGVRIFRIPLDGGAPVRLTNAVSSNPVWSPDGRFIIYSGTPRARSVPVLAVSPTGAPFSFPALTVDRLGDSYRFLPTGKQLVVKLGGFRDQNFWLLDVDSGRRRLLTAMRPGDAVYRFDVSPDGKRILFERVRENADVALIELPH